MELLKKLTQTPSPSGNEDGIRDIIKSEVEKFADDVFTDALGSLIVHIKGNGKRAMICAHADEIGVMVTFIDEKGFLRFAPVGGLDKYCCLYQRVRFSNGAVGVVGYEEAIEDMKELKLSNMYIDIGAKNKEEAEKIVSIGDMAVFSGDMETAGDHIISKALDNRIGVYILIDVIKHIKNSPYDLYFVFSSQEEVGLRGAKGAGFDVNPDIALAVDVTATGDTPNCNRMAVKMGDGACIKVMDKSVICSKSVRDCLTDVAEGKDIKVQYEVLDCGGTDAGAMQLTRGGVLTGAVSVPTRYIHTPSEMVNINDVNECIRLIGAFLEKNMFGEQL